MIDLRTPGVYIREVETQAPPGLRLDITGFVGQAERGPLDLPQPLPSWGQYLQVFGDFGGFGYLPYTVFAFFANGGERCYVVRVAPAGSAKAVLKEHPGGLPDQKGTPIIKVEAINKGQWGNGIEVVAEAESTDELILTELEAAIPRDASEALFKSVAGFFDGNGGGEGDRVTLIHPGNPTQQMQLHIHNIVPGEKRVMFEPAVNHPFPEGSKILGKGIKLTFRYMREGKLVDGEIFDNLSMDPDHERYFVRVINGDPEEPDYVKKIEAGHSILVRVTDLCNSQPDTCSRIETATDTLSGGEDGDATKLKASHLTGYENGLLPQPDQLNGLAALEAVEEIGLIGIPDLIVPDFYELTQQRSLPLPQEGIIFAEIPRQELDLVNLKTGQADMLLHCLKKGNRFAILDAPPAAEIGKGKNKIEDWPNHFQLSPAAKYGALYYPWIKQKSDDFQGRELFIPPGGHLAGIYARSELERGIGKSPANEILRGAVELEFCLSDAENAILNPRSVNCLRVLPGRGLRVWGARTLSLESLSRYVNVRRVTLAIVKNILVNIQTLVFEPNDRNLRRTISSTLNTFFLGLFQSGVLAGATPDEAFSVKCDEENNPPEIIDRGQVITDIGFAPAKPAEFIFVTIIRSADSLSVSEQ